MDELLAAIPPAFAGVFDLSVCNSFAFGESIKRRRPDCTVIENVFLARVVSGSPATRWSSTGWRVSPRATAMP